MRITNVQLAERIEAWQKRLSLLGIAHFRVERVTVCDIANGDRDNKATVSVSPTYDTCKFEFADWWIKSATAKQLDESIIHEWIHVALRDFDSVLDLIEPWMPAATWETFDDTLRQRRESIVERLARQLYQLAKPSAKPRVTY